VIVAVDGTTDRLSIAVGIPGRPAVSRSLEGARRHTAELPGLVDEVLAAASGGWSNVTAVVLADGPGGFTGLRVSAAWAKGVVRARGLRLGAASTLLVRAVPLGQAGHPVVGVGNAMRGELFCARYRFEPDGSILELEGPRLVSAIGTMAEPGDLVAEGLPDAADLVALAGRPGGVHWVDQVASWEPRYGRPAEAQVRWERVHGVGLDDPAGHGG